MLQALRPVLYFLVVYDAGKRLATKTFIKL